MEIIPVIDLKNGLAVSGKSGDRNNYFPINSIILGSSIPKDVVSIYKENGAKKVYIADLDSIMNFGNNFETINELNIFKIVDVGIKDYNDFKNVKGNFEKIILGTETLKDYELLNEKDIILSLDFKDGILLNHDLDELLSRINIETPLIILDISAVGTQNGVNIELIKNIVKKTKNPIYVGGGIKSEHDLKILNDIGVFGVLIGTTIHNGTLDLKKIIQKYGE
ncbi:hisA/hisF family protein [Methanococcus vannielii SB]|uniref:HisA/hisF family protein n=1 Tax=Methanococcus vannielii (strain ATCC 35089 / DSM 1224 / JCM 13029 / OCM 148 / SB) TaxID=406327 RepID=A6UQX3_METVS|nr:HisA/HisF family protein [Methanococcus vannielii]ABR54895.1 hisA/hisF family protein [Methanococcus vannielii SB]